MKTVTLSNKGKCLIKLREIDSLNEQLFKLEKKKQNIYLEISELKKAIILENEIYLWKFAKAIDLKGNILIKQCISIRCSEDFEPVFEFSERGERNKLRFLSWA
jgi:hypothetical protein